MDTFAIQNHLRSMPGLSPLEDVAPAMEFTTLTDHSAEVEGRTFRQLLSDSLAKVNGLEAEADQAIRNLAAGKTSNIHETLITMQKAELSMRLAIEIRNKLMSALQEIMRMQV